MRGIGSVGGVDKGGYFSELEFIIIETEAHSFIGEGPTGYRRMFRERECREMHHGGIKRMRKRSLAKWTMRLPRRRR